MQRIIVEKHVSKNFIRQFNSVIREYLPKELIYLGALSIFIPGDRNTIGADDMRRVRDETFSLPIEQPVRQVQVLRVLLIVRDESFAIFNNREDISRVRGSV